MEGTFSHQTKERSSVLALLFLCSLFLWESLFKCVSGFLEGFPGGSDGKEFVCNAGDQVQSLDREDSLGEGNGYPLQYSCLENPMDRGDWWATIHGVPKNQTCLSNQHLHFHWVLVIYKKSDGILGDLIPDCPKWYSPFVLSSSLEANKDSPALNCCGKDS